MKRKEVKTTELNGETTGAVARAKMSRKVVTVNLPDFPLTRS